MIATSGFPILRPLRAASLSFPLLLSACQPDSGPSLLDASACEVATPIAEVQGHGDVSPLLGESRQVTGVVTMLQPGAGFFIQSSDPDDSDLTSEGLFIEDPALAAQVGRADHVAISGVVSEIGASADTLTAIGQVAGYRVCDRHRPVPSVRLTRASAASGLESLEAMNLEIAEELTVTGNYNAAQGDLHLSLDALLFTATEISRPGDQAREIGLRNRANSIMARTAGSAGVHWPAGTRILSGSGVMGHDGNGLLLLLREDLNEMLPRLDAPARADEGHVRVVSFNLLNYFNGDGAGGGFPAARGARTAEEFTRQRARHRATFELLQPDLLAVMELENDGFGEHSAAADLVSDLHVATGHEWRALAPADGPVGSDQITVGLFYRPEILEPVGATRLLDSAPFQGRSRQPMAQVFAERASGQRLLVVVNHFKSKGGCPPSGRDADLLDGQGCWNQARSEAAREVSAWSRTLADTLADGRALVVGDFNAFRLEDPITLMLNAGFSDLTAPTGPFPSFSHIFRGQAGTLDYAFATESLTPSVKSARVLNINSPWPPGIELPQAWLRSSDHDPVVVDLRLRHNATRD